MVYQHIAPVYVFIVIKIINLTRYVAIPIINCMFRKSGRKQCAIKVSIIFSWNGNYMCSNLLYICNMESEDKVI